MSITPTPKRSEVWLVQFDPAVGAEIRKIRPAVVVNIADVGALPLHIVVPLTSWKPHYATATWLVHIPASSGNGLRNDSGADAFQVKSVSDNRLVRRLGVVTPLQVDAIATAIALCVGAP
jgi:mRNA interferase MazF